MSDNSGRHESGPVVVVASPAAGLRRRFRQILQRGYEVHEVAQRQDLEQKLLNRSPAVLLLDLALPGLNGPSGIGAIHKLRALTKVIGLTGGADEREGIALLKAGARGYCDRDIDAALLEKATEVVLRGEIWVGRKLIPYLLEELTRLTEQQRRHTPTNSDDARLEK